MSTASFQTTFQKARKSGVNTIQQELLQLALALADSAAISDIECCCDEPSDSTRKARWYDTATRAWPDEGNDKVIATALRYLELRGILMRKPGHPHVVAFDRSRIAEAA